MNPKPYLTVIKRGGGFTAALISWSQDIETYVVENIASGIVPYGRAVQEAKNWAKEEALEYHENPVLG